MIAFMLLNMLDIKTNSAIQTIFFGFKLIPIMFAILSGLYLFSGSYDRVATQAELMAWKNCSRGRFEHREFKGGHFFLQDSAEEFTACIGRVISTIMQEPDEDLVAF